MCVYVRFRYVGWINEQTKRQNIHCSLLQESWTKLHIFIWKLPNTTTHHLTLAQLGVKGLLW